MLGKEKEAGAFQNLEKKKKMFKRLFFFFFPENGEEGNPWVTVDEALQPLSISSP